MVSASQYYGPVAGLFNYSQVGREVSGILRLMGMPAVLRRVPEVGPATNHPCIVFISRWRSVEMMGRLFDPLERKCLMSPQGLTITPDHETDSLITYVQPLGTVQNEILRIVAVPERIEPAGVLCAYRLRVRA